MLFVMLNWVVLVGGLFIVKYCFMMYDFISFFWFDLIGKNVLIIGVGWESGVGFVIVKVFVCVGVLVIVVVDLCGVVVEFVE